MANGVEISESAFLGEENDYDDYCDEVIKIEIRGVTVDEIDKVAQAAGLTAVQWIRVTIAAELLKSANLTKRTELGYQRSAGSFLGHSLHS